MPHGAGETPLVVDRPAQQRRDVGRPPAAAASAAATATAAAPMIAKCGFSVVAATSETSRFSTPGSSASCWVLEKRCTSSTNSTVSRPPRASDATGGVEHRPHVLDARRRPPRSRRSPGRWRGSAGLAMVVLPVPGGPHSSTDIGWSPSIRRRSGEPSTSRWSWPTSSSSVRGRIRTASGLPAWAGSARLPPPPRRRAGGAPRARRRARHRPPARP